MKLGGWLYSTKISPEFELGSYALPRLPTSEYSVSNDYSGGNVGAYCLVDTKLKAFLIQFITIFSDSCQLRISVMCVVNKLVIGVCGLQNSDRMFS